MHFTCRYFTGHSESNSWSHYWENEPDDPLLKSSKGHLFALININSTEDKDLSQIGHDLNFEFNQNYFNPENKLDTLSNLKQSINSILSNPLYSSYQINFSAVIVLNKQVFLAAVGDVKVILKRQNQVSLLLNNPGDKIEILTGNLQVQDRIFLVTNPFFEKITWQKIKAFLADDDINTLEENFLSTIFSLPDQKNLAAAFIQIENGETKIEPSTLIKNPIISSESSTFVSHHPVKQITKRRKLLFGGIVLLLIILGASFYFGRQKFITQKNENQYQQLKTEIESQIQTITQTKSLNVDSAQELAVSAQSLINQMSDLNIHQDEVEDYETQINNLLAQTGSSQNYSPDLVYDLSGAIDNSQFDQLLFNQNEIYLLDSVNGQIYYFDLTSEELNSFIESTGVKQATDFTFSSDNLYLMSDSEISLIDSDDIVSQIDLSEISPTDFKFWNSAAYVLDDDNQTIWKFGVTSDGFSSAQTWLKNDVELDSGAISLSIDGDVWILFKNGDLIPYSSGVEQEFIPNQTSDITQASNLKVALDQEYLVFVDNQKIIYLYLKTGELESKYNLGDLEIDDIALDEDSDTIYILCSNQKIYSIAF